MLHKNKKFAILALITTLNPNSDPSYNPNITPNQHSKSNPNANDNLENETDQISKRALTFCSLILFMGVT